MARGTRPPIEESSEDVADAEMAREKAGYCPKADNTREIVDCLGQEIGTSTANYKTYAGALRSMLVQKNPYGDAANDATGATGKPLSAQEQAKNFDQVEAAWTKYIAKQCVQAPTASTKEVPRLTSFQDHVN
jgi:hypothetical protein